MIDLVGGARDARADRGGDPLALAPSEIIAAIAWSVTPADRAAPAGMGGADHAGLGIGEQHRRAVGGDDAEQQARAGR